MQILRKEEVLKQALEKFLSVPLEQTVTSPEKFFRNKAKLIVSGTVENPVIGLIDKEILDCPVHHPSLNKLAHDLIFFIQEAKLVPYDISAKKGELKGLIIYHGDESYLRFVLRSKEALDRIKKLLPDLLNKHPELKSVSVNIQPIHQAILEGEEEISLGPQNFIEQYYRNFKLRLRPQGFVQTNQFVAGKLYETASEWVKGKEIKNFLELFSGQGAFSFHCAQWIQKGLGIEINTEAVKMANETAAALNLSHLNFLSIDAGQSKAIIESFRPDLLLVNPPRRGLGESLQLVKTSGIKNIIYSSCSVESLAKDLASLSDRYRIDKIQIFDMFPHTEHFETLTLLSSIVS